MTTPINAPSGSTTAPEATGPRLVAPPTDTVAPRSGRAKRRSFSAEFKRRIVAEYDAAPAGAKGRCYAENGSTTRTSRNGGPPSPPAPLVPRRNPAAARVARSRPASPNSNANSTKPGRSPGGVRT